MKILKHGQQLYGFICDGCGCVWRAAEEETENGRMHCPECNYITRGFVMYPKYVVVPLSMDDQILLKQIENHGERLKDAPEIPQMTKEQMEECINETEKYIPKTVKE